MMKQQNSKEEILKSIRENKKALSDINVEYEVNQAISELSPEELRDKFKQSLKTAGANVIEVKKDEIEKILDTFGDDVLDFRNSETCKEYSSSCPLEKLEKIEHLLLQGNFGVAENGAIWLQDKDFPNRLLPFITQHLILILDIRAIVPTMQNAYQLIKLTETGFGVFISGPSKTADIEQSLVYGAHGAKELTVLLI